jgi:hypothetical protein
MLPVLCISRNVFIYFLLFIISEATEKPGRVAIPVSVDSTQEEALSILKKLKVCG